MTKKQRKKLKVVDYDSDTKDAEVSTTVRNEIVYEDTKEITGTEHELNWGQIYPMMVEWKVPETGLGDLVLYENILKYGMTKIATKLEIIPCAKFIGWMFPKIDTVGMMINDEKGQPLASFAPTFISASYSLPEEEVSVTT